MAGAEEELVSVIMSGECWSDEGIAGVAASLSLEDGSEAEVAVVASMFVEVGLPGKRWNEGIRIFLKRIEPDGGRGMYFVNVCLFVGDGCLFVAYGKGGDGRRGRGGEEFWREGGRRKGREGKGICE